MSAIGRCPGCGTPVQWIGPGPAAERVLVHRVTEGSEDTMWIEEWQEHRPEQCEAIRWFRGRSV